jgi:hypothetical protein
MLAILMTQTSAILSAHDNAAKCGPLKRRIAAVAPARAAQRSYFSHADLKGIWSDRLENVDCKQALTERGRTSLACSCSSRAEGKGHW